MKQQEPDLADLPQVHGTYQVWHADPKAMLRCRKLGIDYDGGYSHVADVESAAWITEAVARTTHGKRPWPDNPGVIAHSAKPRSTRTGDLIVSPCGAVWKIEEDYFETVDAAIIGRGSSTSSAPELSEPFDLTRSIIEYEANALDEAATVQLFQHLIDTGLAWKLQGHYGREANSLLEAGLITRPEPAKVDPVGAALDSAREPRFPEGANGREYGGLGR